MLCPQSSIELIAETICTIWKYVHLMLFNNWNTLRQSSNMLSLNALTTGLTIYLHHIGISENIPLDKCPAYTEVVRLA